MGLLNRPRVGTPDPEESWRRMEVARLERRTRLCRRHAEAELDHRLRKKAPEPPTSVLPPAQDTPEGGA